MNHPEPVLGRNESGWHSFSSTQSQSQQWFALYRLDGKPGQNGAPQSLNQGDPRDSEFSELVGILGEVLTDAWRKIS